MRRPSNALKLEDVKVQASARKREMIPPKVVVKVTTPAERGRVIEMARRVIAEHRDVLVALKDR